MGLHWSEDDSAFASAHAAAGERKKDARIRRLENLLQKVRSEATMSDALTAEITATIAMTFFDEDER